ncbi:FAD-dependent oxidoreductase [Rhodococcus sp. USK13]|uniref:NAD(P)/FAD-dependent oxidoreductase n=1 Tax=Rhodococcus sp. USK13 TaxID=2806442 RepID=UPI001BCADE3E|nr:FAD-dependent oxidoreductase [Rhodococcus sp. USK13]
MSSGAVIVGANQAGVQLAISLREGGYTESITLISDEGHLPYQRPPLSKGLLRGTADAESLILRNEAFYSDNNITLVRSQKVIDVDRDGQGGRARTDTGQVHPFRHLALTVGARVRHIPVPGSDLAGVLYLRDMDDALSLAKELDDAHDVVVIGGGFIGLEAASAANEGDRHVTVVEAADRLMARAVDDRISSYFLRAHRERGIDVVLGSGVRELIGLDGRIQSVRLTDGRTLSANIVIVGIGVDPRTELAQSMGLACDNGILVDEISVASDGATVAAGDCASMPNPTNNQWGRCRIESVNNAVEQAKNAARTLLGAPMPYQLTPWFWSNQGNLKLQIVGDVSHPETVGVLRGDSSSDAFSVLFYHDERLVGAQCVNRPVDFVNVRTILGRTMTVPRTQASDLTISLKNLAVDISTGAVA